MFETVRAGQEKWTSINPLPKGMPIQKRFESNSDWIISRSFWNWNHCIHYPRHVPFPDGNVYAVVVFAWNLWRRIIYSVLILIQFHKQPIVTLFPTNTFSMNREMWKLLFVLHEGNIYLLIGTDGELTSKPDWTYTTYWK